MPELLITLFDPAISKIGILQPGETGLLGEQLEWVFTVTNIGNGTGYDVVVSDTLVPELQIVGVAIDPNVGSYTINGQTVTVFIPSLAPGQSINFSIITIVLVSDQEIENTAVLTASNLDGERQATGLVVSRLPETGETPWWREVTLALIVLGAAAAAVSAGVASRRQLRR